MITHRRSLTDQQRQTVTALVEQVTAERGYAPLGESKRVELDSDEESWSALLASDGERLVGYGHLSWPEATSNETPGPRAVVEVFAADEAPAQLEVELLEAAIGVVAARGGGLLWSWAHHVIGHAPPQVALGFGVQRRLAVMKRGLTQTPGASWPEGVRLASFRPGRDEQAFLRVNNAAFAGHPENGGWDEAELGERWTVAGTTPEDLLMAWRDGELLGFHWTRVHGDGLGEVYVLAVDPGARGLGLGRSLLRAGLSHLAGRGCREAILYVDDTDRSAVQLYRSEGFQRRWDEVCYELDVPPSGSSL